jgi:tRNA-splicing ligase RtcB (3'-phosphate/5'-hydroxy nucleic acid ligase)
MKGSDLLEMGMPRALVPEAFQLIRQMAGRGVSGDEMRRMIEGVIENPQAFVADPELRPLAEGILARPKEFEPREAPAPFRIWGEGLEPGSVQQMRNAADLPVAVRGALMPDAHQGYGLPIGGVLATENAVIPYAVGVDIACRMRMSVFGLEEAEQALASPAVRDRLRVALEGETRFGVGARFDGGLRRDHPVMEADWKATPVTAKLRDLAWTQLGTSGSGNHFVEFGLLELARPAEGLAPGTYLALLSHSGSRGTGATVASHYSKLAQELHPDLPKELRNLAWLSLDLAEGQEYWHAMNLMGEYAAANHERIHHHVAKALGFEVLAVVENHHNFAWKEEHEGRELIVHRKGATPAGAGVLGVIPGTMADPAFLVSGLGDPASLRSASHGAGRRMSRTEAKRRFTWEQTRALLEARGVELLSADLDEAPMAYKDIREVMAAQTDLVDVLGTFHPRLVKMAPAGERAED